MRVKFKADLTDLQWVVAVPAYGLDLNNIFVGKSRLISYLHIE
jgi:hypothetical protein